MDKIKEDQWDYPKLIKIIKKVEEGSIQDFVVKDGVLKFRAHLCIPNDSELKKELLKESHDSTLTTHPGSTRCTET